MGGAYNYTLGRSQDAPDFQKIINFMHFHEIVAIVMGQTPYTAMKIHDYNGLHTKSQHFFQHFFRFFDRVSVANFFFTSHFGRMIHTSILLHTDKCLLYSEN